MNRSTLYILFGLTCLSVIVALGGWSDVKLPNNHQGYAPAQPIPFSHRMHAGMLKIDCQYCHTAADDGRHAAIPPLATCMNCHGLVKGSTEEGKAAIAKIADHYARGEPLRWVRVHNMPDFVYFNHSAHVAKGVACQTCHGPVEEMGVMRQHSDLSMGWCVSCHRDMNASGKALHAPTDCSACHR